MAVHVALLSVATVLLIAVILGSSWLDAHTDNASTSRPIFALVAGSLIIGNAACLLPDTPRWYSAAVIAATCASVVWATLSVRRAASNTSARRHREAVERYAAYANHPAVRGRLLRTEDADVVTDYASTQGADLTVIKGGGTGGSGPAPTLRVIDGDAPARPRVPTVPVGSPVVASDLPTYTVPHTQRRTPEELRRLRLKKAYSTHQPSSLISITDA